MDQSQGLKSVQRMLRTPGLALSYVGVTLAGCGASILFALLPVYAVLVLDASPTQVGLYFTIATLGGIPVTLLTGILSDKFARPRIFALCILAWVTVGIVAAAVVPTFTALLFVGAFMLSFVDASNSQVLARGRSLLVGEDPRFATFAGSVLRSGYSLGYVVGPLLAAVALGFASPRSTILLSAFVYLGALLGHAGPAARRRVANQSVANFPAVSILRLVLTCLAFIPVMTAPVVRAAYLALYATEARNLELSTVIRIVAVAPVAEIVLIPVCGAIGARLGHKVVIVMGAVVAAVEMFLTALAIAAWQFVVLQALGAFVLACQVSAGMTYLQGLLGTRPGLGTSLFFTSRAVASAVGAGLGGFIAGAFGYHSVFVVAAIFASIGVIALFLVVNGESVRPPVCSAVNADSQSVQPSSDPVGAVRTRSHHQSDALTESNPTDRSGPA